MIRLDNTTKIVGYPSDTPVLIHCHRIFDYKPSSDWGTPILPTPPYILLELIYLYRPPIRSGARSSQLRCRAVAGAAAGCDESWSTVPRKMLSVEVSYGGTPVAGWFSSWNIRESKWMMTGGVSTWLKKPPCMCSIVYPQMVAIFEDSSLGPHDCQSHLGS